MATQDLSPNVSAYIARYLRARVTVYYLAQTTYNDTGVLTYLDGTWLELLKGNDERLLIPLSAIRIVKVLDTLEPDRDADTLLRAASDSGARQKNLEQT